MKKFFSRLLSKIGFLSTNNSTTQKEQKTTATTNSRTLSLYTYPYKDKQLPVYMGINGGYFIEIISNEGVKYKRYIKEKDLISKGLKTYCHGLDNY